MRARFHELRSTVPRRLVEPLGRGLARTGISPNVITLLGFLLSAATAVVLANGHFFVGGLLVLFSGAFDLLDGALARVTGRVTKFGAILDSTLDRLSEAALFFGLLVFYLSRASQLEVILIYVTLVASLLVSYLRARAEGAGLNCEMGLMTRPERVVLLALGLLLGQMLLALWLLAVLTSVTVVQRLFYLWQITRRE